MNLPEVTDFDSWRRAAKNLLVEGYPPDSIPWPGQVQRQTNLFTSAVPLAPPAGEIMVPVDFIPFARKVACHADPDRWHLMYQALWRLCRGEKHLLKLKADPLVHRLETMHHAVGRDTHKMKAFVRFRPCIEDGVEHYIAWHRPDHNVLALAAPFFQQRFAIMHWTIMTPYASAHWDGEKIYWAAGVPEAPPAHADTAEKLWLDYYRATFNPARIKLKAMRREMPVRHWPTLPETALIDDMLAEAPARVEAMLKYTLETLPEVNHCV